MKSFQSIVKLASERVISAYVSEGNTVEVGSIRIHRFREAYRVTDLTNAGLRGKKCDGISITVKGFQDVKDVMEEIAWALEGAKTFAKVKQIVTTDLAELHPELEIRVDPWEERGIDVVPAGFKPIEVVGDKVKVSVGYKEFVVTDLVDTQNETTCIPKAKGGLKSIPAFYRWVKDNESKVKKMSFSEVLEQMGKIGLPYHQFCAID